MMTDLRKRNTKKSYNILIIEDEKLLYDLLKKKMESLGLSIRARMMVNPLF